MKRTPTRPPALSGEIARLRRFTTPNGRHWTAEVYEVPSGLGVRTAGGVVPAQSVLRFSSGDLTLDLVDYPLDWTDRSVEDLVALVRQAKPPSFTILASNPNDQGMRA